jgi:hypothetical protein
MDLRNPPSPNEPYLHCSHDDWFLSLQSMDFVRELNCRLPQFFQAIPQNALARAAGLADDQAGRYHNSQVFDIREQRIFIIAVKP